MKTAVSKRTQTDFIREILADRIVHGLLRPGESLDEASFAAEFGVSRTPVREALRQLEMQGLALSRPHRGAVVTILSERQLDDTFVVMAELEALCARLCATTMAGDGLDALSRLHDMGSPIARRDDVAAYRLHNARFHDAIYAGSNNPFLEETTRATRRRLAPFRNLQFEAFHRTDASHREHGLIVSAIIAGDALRAADTMRQHILTVRRIVEDVKVDEIRPAS
jgi:DNA-binding GntR family transcriptional regulator